MKDEHRSDSAADGDWQAVTQHYVKEQGDELAFADLQPGDRLQVNTRNTNYQFTWIGGAEWDAELQTDRRDRPGGRVRLVGCAFGAGTTIAPGRLFSGGSMEYTSRAGELVHRTSPITAIRLLRHLSP